MEKEKQIKKDGIENSSDILEICPDTKKAFMQERDVKVRRYIQSLENWREQSLKCAKIF